MAPPPSMELLVLTVLLMGTGCISAPWAAWMPPKMAALSGTCVQLPCRFDYPEELRPASIGGLWYFGSPYPKNYPPVVARSRPSSAVHESFAGRASFLGDPTGRDCTLNIARLSEELAGKYYFRGDLGGYNQYSFSEHAELDVWAAPHLEVPHELVAGSEAEILCRVPDNCPPLRPLLTWTGTEELLDPIGKERIEDDLGSKSLLGSLRFRPRKEDLGRRVGCGVTFINSSLSFQADVGLDVQYEPQVVGLWGPTEVVEGSDVELGCEAEGRPAPLISWFRGSEVLREEPGRNLRLLLSNVGPDDGGSFSCVAENRHGRHNRSLQLRVAYAPRAPVINGSLWVVSGDPVSVTCRAESEPAAILTVLRGGKVMAAAIYEDHVTMEMAAARPEDGGTYSCVAENQHGASSTSFNISVEYPPLVLPASRCTAGGDGVYPPLVLPDSRCTAGGDGVRCVCMVNSIPDSSLVFELPTRNQTVSDGHRDFTAAPPGSDGSITGILTLRGPLEPRLLVLCAARNRHGTTARQLRFHHPGGLVWAKVGPVGAVVAFAIVIAVVCYLSQSRRKKGAGSPEVTPVQPMAGPGGDPDLDLRPQQVRWLRGAMERWALGVKEGSGAPQEVTPTSHPPMKPTRGPLEDPPEYAEIRVK